MKILIRKLGVIGLFLSCSAGQTAGMTTQASKPRIRSQQTKIHQPTSHPHFTSKSRYYSSSQPKAPQSQTSWARFKNFFNLKKEASSSESNWTKFKNYFNWKKTISDPNQSFKLGRNDFLQKALEENHLRETLLAKDKYGYLSTLEKVGHQDFINYARKANLLKEILLDSNKYSGFSFLKTLRVNGLNRESAAQKFIELAREDNCLKDVLLVGFDDFYKYPHILDDITMKQYLELAQECNSIDTVLTQNFSQRENLLSNALIYTKPDDVLQILYFLNKEEVSKDLIEKTLLVDEVRNILYFFYLTIDADIKKPVPIPERDKYDEEENNRQEAAYNKIIKNQITMGSGAIHNQLKILLTKYPDIRKRLYLQKNQGTNKTLLHYAKKITKKDLEILDGDIDLLKELIKSKDSKGFQAIHSSKCFKDATEYLKVLIPEKDEIWSYFYSINLHQYKASVFESPESFYNMRKPFLKEPDTHPEEAQEATESSTNEPLDAIDYVDTIDDVKE